MTETTDPLVLFMPSGSAGVACSKAGIRLQRMDFVVFTRTREPQC